MSDEYYVKLTGNLLGGRAPDMAAQFLSDTFHIPFETGRTYFQGNPTVLKKKLDRATAEKVLDRLRNAGAECKLEPVPDLGLTLELLDDAPAPPAPEPVPEPAPAPATAEEDDFSMELELIDVPETRPEPKPSPPPPSQPEPISVDDLQFDTVEPAAEADLSLEMVDEPPAAEPPGLSLELSETEPAPAKSGGLELDDLPVEEPPPREPAPAPEPEMEAPPPPPPAAADEDSEGEVHIGDVTSEVASGGGVGGMLPQASTAPSFRRPGQIGDDETEAPAKKLLVPIAGGVLLLVLAVAGYFLFLSEPEPVPAAAAKEPVKKKPVKVDNTLFIQLQTDELKAKLESLGGSIVAWRQQFASSAAKATTPEAVKAALKTDMGIGDTDWTDPWGGVIEYQPMDTGFSLVSAGPDKKPGTEDDIRSEQKP